MNAKAEHTKIQNQVLAEKEWLRKLEVGLDDSSVTAATLAWRETEPNTQQKSTKLALLPRRVVCPASKTAFSKESTEPQSCH